MKDERFTIITCSYNTPIVTECLLKSYYKYHPGVRHRLILIDNSTDSSTMEMLNKYDVPYVNGLKVLPKSPTKDDWWYHHTGLDWAVNNCTTPYCLIVDTDILIRASLIKFFDIFTSQPDYVAMGEHMPKDIPKTYRNGKVIPIGEKYVLPRIHPCFMLLDVNFFKEHNLTFSEPEQNDKLPDNERYDIGSYLLQKIYELGKKTIRIESNDSTYIHSGGLSWADGLDMKHDFYKNTVMKDLHDIDINKKYFTDIPFTKTPRQ